MTANLPTRPDGACCPNCGQVGRAVGNATLAAILRPDRVVKLLAVPRRFCAAPSCDVLYYGADGRFVGKEAAVVRIGLKETEDPVPLCYCLGFTRADVRSEVALTGRCTVPERIIAALRRDRCACDLKNPSGTLCMGEVRRTIVEALAKNRIVARETEKEKNNG